MARKTHLHSVEGDAAHSPPPAPEVPSSITAALDGSTRDVLAAMRKALAQKLDDGDVSSNAIASAYKELRELDRLIRTEDRAALAEWEAKQAKGGQGDGSRRSFNASAI